MTLKSLLKKTYMCNLKLKCKKMGLTVIKELWSGISIEDTSKRVYNKTNFWRGKWEEEASIQNSLKKMQWI